MTYNLISKVLSAKILKHICKKVIIVLNIRLQWDISSLFGQFEGLLHLFEKVLISGLLSDTMVFAAKKGFGV